MGRQAIPCQSCECYPWACSSCKSILKHEMAGYLRGEIKVYLSELNRGNKEKRLSDADIVRTWGVSCRKAGKYFGVSAQTISRCRREYAARVRKERGV